MISTFLRTDARLKIRSLTSGDSDNSFSRLSYRPLICSSCLLVASVGIWSSESDPSLRPAFFIFSCIYLSFSYYSIFAVVLFNFININLSSRRGTISILFTNLLNCFILGSSKRILLFNKAPLPIFSFLILFCSFSITLTLSTFLRFKRRLSSLIASYLAWNGSCIL